MRKKKSEAKRRPKKNAARRLADVDLNRSPAWPRKASTLEEIPMASIAIESTLSDVTSVLARRYKDKVYYRVVDDNGFVYGRQITRNVRQPLKLGELARYFLSAWDLFEVLKINFEAEGYPLEKVRAFYKPSSDFYADFGKLINQRVEQWLTKRHSRLRA
jgi:hypothetical protein